MQPGQIVEAQRAITLLRAAIAQRQQPGEPPPAAPRRGIGDDVGRAIGEHQPRADRQFETQRRGFRQQFAHRDMRLHDPGHGVAIGNADAVMAQRCGAAHHVTGG